MTQLGSASARTATSWGRTALGMAGFAILLLRLGIARHVWLEVGAGCVAVVSAAGLGWHGRIAYSRAHPAPSALTMRAASGALAVVGLLAILGAIL